MIPLTSYILGTGSYLPTERITNEELGSRFGLTPAQIVRRTGIRERRRAAPAEAASDLGLAAAEAALKSAGIDPAGIDLIVVSTTSPDLGFPSTACLIQGRLGVRRAPAFDLSASCAGFLAALWVADRFLRSGEYARALVIGTEVKSRFIDPADPATALLFGDGAGAVVLGRSGPGPQLGPIQLSADGSRHRYIMMPAGGTREPATIHTVRAGRHTLKMKGGAVYRAAVRELEAAIRSLWDRTRLGPEEIRHAVFHQANRRILHRLASRLELPLERLVLTIDRFGNTSSSSIPIALDDAARSGRFAPGDWILLAAFGGGLAWGCGLIRWA